MMPNLLLSFDVDGELDEPQRAWVLQWSTRLRERGLKAMIAASCTTLLALERAKAYDLLDILAWHEGGLHYQPGPLPKAGSPGNQHWWQDRLESHMEQLAGQLEIFRRLHHQAPVAVTTSPQAYTPQIGLAASRLGITKLAHAPFEDKAPGMILCFSGCGYLRRHLDLAPWLSGKLGRKRLEQELERAGVEMTAASRLVVGCTLSDTRIVARQQRGEPGELEGILSLLYDRAGGKPSGYADLPRQRAVQYLSPVAIRALSREISWRLRPLQHDGFWLSLGELLSVFVQAGVQIANHGSVHERVYPLNLLGPYSPPPELSDILVRRDEILKACLQLAPELIETGRLPAIIRVEGKPTTPSSFLFSLAQLLHHDTISLIKLPGGPLPQFYATHRMIRQVADDIAEQSPSPEGRLTRNAILCQSWTAKPWS